jgi:hypothetical protein
VWAAEATGATTPSARSLLGRLGPFPKRYVGVATATRPSFQADKDVPMEEFVAEADRHPVVELLPGGIMTECHSRSLEALT